MGLTCGGKELEISRAEEMVDAMEDLQLSQYELRHSEKKLQEMIQRKKWHDFTAWEKFKMMFGWSPNGGSK